MNLLLIDDERRFHKSLKESLLSSRFTIHYASDLQGAIGVLEENKIDVILLDLLLEGYDTADDGIINVERLLKKVPNIPIVVVTQYSSENRAVQCVLKGARDFFNKYNFNPAVWIDKLTKYAEEAKSPETLKNIRKLVYKPKKVHDSFVTASPEIVEIKNKLRKIAKFSEEKEINILIQGEPGVGKEEATKYFRQISHRANQPFVALNLSAVPNEHFEMELFGSKKDVFSGVLKDRVGNFEQADGGILFLDEIGEVSLDVQKKLLRVVQFKKVKPIGGDKEVEVDIQLIAATNKNLSDMVKLGTFRQDLYDRLKGYVITIPPLRKRKEDVIVIAESYLDDTLDNVMDDDTKQKLLDYNWRGNVRELINTLKSMQINQQLEDLEIMTVECLPEEIRDFNHRFVSETTPNTSYEAPEFDDFKKQDAYNKLLIIEEGLSKKLRKGDIAKSISTDTDGLRSFIKVRHGNYPDLFDSFPLICEAYKISVPEGVSTT